MNGEPPIWEQEGGVLGDLGPGRHPKSVLDMIRELMPTRSTNHVTALALYRAKCPSAELCLVGDRWRIEYDWLLGDRNQPEYAEWFQDGAIEVWRT